MSDEERRTIADSERTPMNEAADKVEFGPSAYTEQDKREEEPEGTAGPSPDDEDPGETGLPPSGNAHV